MGQGEYHYRQLAACLPHRRGVKAQQRIGVVAPCVKLLSVRLSAANTEPGRGSRLRSSSGASSARLSSLPFEFMVAALGCRVCHLLVVVLGVVRRRSAGADLCIGDLDLDWRRW